MRSGAFAYAHRKDKKGDMRRLWIARINAAVRPFGLNYSRFMHGLSEAGVMLNRKVLADMAVREPEAIGELAKLAKKAIG
jgi:large subunit ribosomal protein L20